MTERVLCVVAHPDDETLGCGGTLAKHAARGDHVSVLVLADGVMSRTGGAINADAFKERHGMFRRACKILGTEDVWLLAYPDNRMDTRALLEVVKDVERHVERFKPTIVYTHSKADLNIDHRMTNEAVQVACRPLPGSTVRLLLYFEVPSSTEWGSGFNPTHFEDITTTLETKLGALSCYTTEIRPFPHPRSTDGVKALAWHRGSSVGRYAAEAFEVGRSIS